MTVPATGTQASTGGRQSAGATSAGGALEQMHPAYFALVMATGIVSLASYLLGYAPVARILFWLNIVFYGLLWVLLACRIARYPQRVAADLAHHGRSVGFFTIVAGTCVLGSQFLIVGNLRAVAMGLWVTGIVLYAVLTYSIFTILTVKTAKPSLAEGINGGWLVAVVAAQSVSVLGAQLAIGAAGGAQSMLFFALTVWLGGGMLYIWIISLIFYRYTFMAMQPADLSPPYWINMGAVAISTLAGTMLIAGAGRSPLLVSLMPFLKGFTLLFWATATWWIPMLLILGIWRHIYRRFPLRYDPLYWGAVFPLGMYTACTFRLADALDQPFLMAIPRVFVFIAWAAWAATFLGLVRVVIGQARTAWGGAGSSRVGPVV